MDSTSSEPLINETYEKAEQIYEKSENGALTNLETPDSRATQVIQTEDNINVRIVPEPPRLRKDQKKTD